MGFSWASVSLAGEIHPSRAGVVTLPYFCGDVLSAGPVPVVGAHQLMTHRWGWWRCAGPGRRIVAHAWAAMAALEAGPQGQVIVTIPTICLGWYLQWN